MHRIKFAGSDGKTCRTSVNARSARSRAWPGRQKKRSRRISEVPRQKAVDCPDDDEGAHRANQDRDHDFSLLFISVDSILFFPPKSKINRLQKRGKKFVGSDYCAFPKAVLLYTHDEGLSVWASVKQITCKWLIASPTGKNGMQVRAVMKENHGEGGSPSFFISGGLVAVNFLFTCFSFFAMCYCARNSARGVQARAAE